MKAKPVAFIDKNCPHGKGDSQSYVLVLARARTSEDAAKKKRDLEKEVSGLMVCPARGEYLIVKQEVQTRSNALLQGIALKKEIKQRDLSPQLLRLKEQ